MNQIINSVVHVKMLSEPVSFSLSVCPSKTKRTTRGNAKKL